MGRRGIAWVAGHPGYDVYAIDADDQATWTATLDELLVPRVASPPRRGHPGKAAGKPATGRLTRDDTDS
jgi:hypothetical protein